MFATKKIAEEGEKSEYKFLFTSTTQVLNISGFLSSPQAIRGPAGQSITPVGGTKLNSSEFTFRATDGNDYFARRTQNATLEIFQLMHNAAGADRSQPVPGSAPAAKRREKTEFTPNSSSSSEYVFHGVRVMNDTSGGMIKSALQRILDGDPKMFEKIRDHAKTIAVHEENTCARYGVGIFVGDVLIGEGQSVNFLVLAIAHEAQHCAQFATWPELTGRQNLTPEQKYDLSVRMERDAFDAAAKTGKKLKFPEYEVLNFQLAAKYGGKHMDANGDGRITDEDFVLGKESFKEYRKSSKGSR